MILDEADCHYRMQAKGRWIFSGLHTLPDLIENWFC